jgi:hypothetical protein
MRQDWPVDNLALQQSAKKRVASLASTLKANHQSDDAVRLESNLARLNRRDLVIQLEWETAGGPAELEMKIQEPMGGVASLQQKQSPGGGVLSGYDLNAKTPSARYVAAEAFSGDFEISISRVYGQPLNNRARLIITQHAGTPEQSRRIEVINVERNAVVKIQVKDGRRTELATITPAAQERQVQKSQEHEQSAFNDLRALANPSFHGAQASKGNTVPSVAAMAARDAKAAPITQNASASFGGVQLMTQFRPGADERSFNMVIRPFFAANANQRPHINLSVVPGSN